jgi:hypothetical protein
MGAHVPSASRTAIGVAAANRKGASRDRYLRTVVWKNRSTKFDVLVRVHNFVVLRENVQKNEKSVRPTIVKWMSDHMYRPPVNKPQTTVNKPQTFANAFKRSLQANAIKRTPSSECYQADAFKRMLSSGRLQVNALKRTPSSECYHADAFK